MDLILCQISKLLPGTDFLILPDRDVQRQEGFDDCILFVLAYMLTLCSGQDPSCVTYKQKEMRGNFNTWLKNKKFETFPHTILKRNHINDIAYVYDWKNEEWMSKKSKYNK